MQRLHVNGKEKTFKETQVLQSVALNAYMLQHSLQAESLQKSLISCIGSHYNLLVAFREIIS
jgi:hypothetical protein